MYSVNELLNLDWILELKEDDFSDLDDDCSAPFSTNEEREDDLSRDFSFMEFMQSSMDEERLNTVEIESVNKPTELSNPHIGKERVSVIPQPFVQPFAKIKESDLLKKLKEKVQEIAPDDIDQDYSSDLQVLGYSEEQSLRIILRLKLDTEEFINNHPDLSKDFNISQLYKVAQGGPSSVAALVAYLKHRSLPFDITKEQLILLLAQGVSSLKALKKLTQEQQEKKLRSKLGLTL
ncbi:hypothetical protein, partial [Legionella sp. WA2022007384]